MPTEWSQEWLMENTRLPEMLQIVGRPSVSFAVSIPGSVYIEGPCGEIARAGIARSISTHADTPSECIEKWWRAVDAMGRNDRLVLRQPDRRLWRTTSGHLIPADEVVAYS